MRPSYLPIVGSGPNACVLHYTANGRQMREGDLLLVDAGCEYDCYASDVTRTYPVERALQSGAARHLRDRARRARGGPEGHAPRAITGTSRTMRRSARSSVACAASACWRAAPRAIVRSGAYRQFFMHRTGHWLGMDVHDVGDYKVGDQWRVLEPGMAMTVEPGIYIPPGTQGRAAALAGHRRAHRG